ncbi:Polysaccharide deacetylase [Marinobacter daqiaonensis]|uniref:Polysaccharide deacetylase n=1 Tax=Marinobacter daqiaonensis TaxID=650891 RepID=A0A1I6H318_9GAMM|nr:polysaccharide deacetylase family protein [Marinobacter daqiaonensis]SFR48727.1 Polysaccharide deacetylase [Marinobacter daqiaonensis]
MLTRSTVALGLVLTFSSTVSHADLVVLQYHHISDQTPAATSTEVGLFRQQLATIQGLDLEVVPLDQGTRDALAGHLDDRQQVAITFDDAYESVWETAAPMLEAHGYPYTIFVNTDAVGKPGYMTWEQLQAAQERGHILIANHSHDHAHLARRPDESLKHWQERAARSLDRAQEILQERLGAGQALFAYPYGEYDEALESMVAARGWYGYGQQSGAVGATSHPTRLPRFPMATAYGQPEALPDKLRSRALPVDAGDLPDGIVGNNPPVLEMTLPEPLKPRALNCFASGQGRIDIDHQGQTVSIQAGEAFDSRRFRYNCTYPVGDGRFYWLSQQWVDLSQPED